MDKDPGETVEYYVSARVHQALDGAEDAPWRPSGAAEKAPPAPGWTGVLALLLGFALVLGSLTAALARWVTRSDGDFWKADWQETAGFRSEISGYVRDFLTLGAGGELEWYDTVLEGTVWETDGGWWGEASTTETAVEADASGAPDAAINPTRTSCT